MASGQNLKNMGVYAEANEAQIVCANSKVAEKVEKALKDQAEKSDKNGNAFARTIKRNEEIVFFYASSGRIQNLEWQLEQIWDKVSKIKGVEELHAPIMSESEGLYFSKE